MKYIAIFIAGYLFGHVAGGRIKQMRFKHLIRRKIGENKHWQMALSLYQKLLQEVDEL